MLGCADFDWAAKPAAPAVQVVQVRSDCIIERHVQIAAGHRLVTWVMRPPGEGPFPVLVWNHGSRIPPASWFGSGSDPGSDDRFRHALPARGGAGRNRCMVFPEGRGYGGSDGPLLAPRLSNVHEVLEFLRWRAADANEATRLIELRPDARKHCTVIGGVSHGGVTALFAAAAAPSLYRAVVIQATGVCYFKACGLDALETAANKVKVPLLVQHFVTDTRGAHPGLPLGRALGRYGQFGGHPQGISRGHRRGGARSLQRRQLQPMDRRLSAEPQRRLIARCDIEERDAEAPPAGAPSMLAAEEIVP